jgi:hypothetical protein
MLTNLKCGSISLRKAKETDDSDNVFNNLNLKLTVKQKEKYDNGKSFSVYISKNLLEKVRKNSDVKEGGFLPLIPLILGGLTTLGTLAGGSAAIANSFINKNKKDQELEEQKRHNIEVEKSINGSGYKHFIKKIDGTSGDKKALKSIFQVLEKFMKVEKQGDGVFLSAL